MKKIIVAMGIIGLFAGFTTSAFAGYFNTTPISRCDSQITNTLQMGSENNDVYTLQQMLVQGSYLFVAPNGFFGPSTKAAVKRFQADNSLSVTGVVGEETRNAVNERLCDTDVRAMSSSYDTYGSNTGVTYVDQYDPYAKVISPLPSSPTVYNTPQADLSMTTVNNVVYANPASYTNPISYSDSNSYYPATTISSPVIVPDVRSIIPATSNIQGTGITYNPSTGFTYSIIPAPGSLTISTPLANSFYKEGDTVYLMWSTNNFNANGFQILLENTSTGQSKQVGFTTSSNASFVLTKDVLDAVCAGACDNSQQQSFRFVVATPYTDISGNTSMFRAMVSQITIKRPYSAYANVTLNASKTPVNSGEAFRVYVNTPSINAWNTNLYNKTTISLHAFCINNVQVSIAGVPCGQDFTVPSSTLTSQQGIPVMITNSTFYSQDIVLEVNVIDPVVGQVIGTSRATVTVNPAPFNW